MAKTKSLKSKHTNKDSYELPKHIHKPKSKSKSRRLSISSQSHFNKIPRGPLLSVTFPTQEELDGDDAPPDVPSTEEEFDNRYTSYAKLHVTDAATGEDTFDDLIRVNDCIQIRPGEVGGVSVEDTEKWYGRVLSIGARKEEDRARPDVCLRIAWFYDHAMLQQRTLSAQDRKRCDNMMENELIASDHYDTVNLASVLGRVNILFFNEYTTSQEEIDTEDFFFRREIRNNRVVMAKDTCTARCKMPYSPAREIQHYCDSCRRWYHTSCMVPSKFHQDDYRLIGHSVSSVEQRLLDLIMHPGPRSKKSLAQGKCSFAKKFPSMPIRNASSETEISTDERSDPHPSMIEALALAEKLPSRIRAYATSAITRGVRSGNGIVGNAWVVLNARWLARQAIVEGKHLTQEEEMQIYEAADTMNLRAGVKLTPLAYECQGCGYPI